MHIKKLEGLLNAYNVYDQNITKAKLWKRIFTAIIIKYMTNRSQYNYENRIDSTNKTKTSKLLFKKKLLKNYWR